MTTVIHIKTKEEFKKVLQIFNKKKWVWGSGDKPLEFINYWDYYKKETCIEYENNFRRADKEYYKKNGYKIISFKKFLKMEGIPKLSEEQTKFELIHCSEGVVKDNIKKCEGKHLQQVAYSSYHEAFTQICFGCKKIRTSLKKKEVNK